MDKRTCAECGASLDGKDRRAKYCSPKCRNRHNNRISLEWSVGPEDHGTRLGYKRGCRCDACRRQNADYSQIVRNRIPKAPKRSRSDKGVARIAFADIMHGSASAYVYHHCRCLNCTKAHSARSAAWRKENPVRYTETNRRYRLANPGRMRGYSAARAAAPFDAEALSYAEVLRGDLCVYCGGSAGQVDHIRPVAQGGDSSWDNLAAACRSCNQSKGAKHLLDYLMYRMVRIESAA